MSALLKRTLRDHAPANMTEAQIDALAAALLPLMAQPAPLLAEPPWLILPAAVSPTLRRPLVADDLIAEQQTEIAIYATVAQAQVGRRRMSQQQADHNLACKRTILELIKGAAGMLPAEQRTAAGYWEKEKAE